MPISQIVTNSIANGAIIAADIASGQTFALNGITFPATQVASADANTLDDYEEGTFTPTAGSGITSPGYSKQVGTYTKIGNTVYIKIGIELNSGTRNATALVIGGLPFTQANFNGGTGFAIGYVNPNFSGSTTTNLPTLYGDAGTVNISFYKTDGSGFLGNELASANFRVDLAGCYTAA